MSLREPRGYTYSPVLQGLREVADEEGSDVADIARIGLKLFVTLREYVRAGRVIVCEDPGTGERDIVNVGAMLRHPST